MTKIRNLTVGGVAVAIAGVVALLVGRSQSAAAAATAEYTRAFEADARGVLIDVSAPIGMPMTGLEVFGWGLLVVAVLLVAAGLIGYATTRD